MVSLSALSRIRSLRSVKIMNPIETLEPLGELTQVKSLRLNAMQPALVDVSLLSRLTALESFDTWQHVDLSAVARAAPKLRELGAYNASGFDALAQFSELRALRLSCFDSKKQRPPEPAKLESLSVSCNDPTAPMDPLLSFLDVLELDLSAVDPSYPEHSPVRSLAIVGRMRKLRRLDIRGTRVTSLAPLAHCPELRWLHIDDTRVKSLAPLARLKHLEEIEATNTPLASIAPLAASPSLVTLWLPGTHVHNVLSLARVKTLHELMLPGSCARPDAVALAKRRPDMKLMMWTDGGSPDCKL
jgi:Leucine-rich repeat (LRR) protein